MIWGVLYIISALLALTCAVQFLVKVGVRKVSISFSLGMICLAAICSAAAVILIYDPRPENYQTLLYKLAGSLLPLAGAASPFFLLIISRNFGRRDDIQSTKGISMLTRMAGLITIVAMYFIVSGMVYESSFLEKGYTLVFKGFLSKSVGMALAILLVLSLLNLENTRRASHGPMRWQVLILMIFNILILAGVVRMFFLGKISSNFIGYMAPIAVTCLIWLYLLLLRKDIYSANIVIDRQAFLSSTVVLFLGIFLVVTGIVAYIIKEIGGRSDVFLSIIGAFLVIGLFLLILLSDSIRSRFTSAMLSRIYAGRFDYKAEWRELSEDFASCDNITNSHVLLVEKIERLFDPAKLILYIVENNKLECHWPENSTIPDIKRNDPLAEWIFLKSEPAYFTDVEESAPSELKRYESEYEVMAPIIAEKKLIGIVLLGMKGNLAPFNEEDFAMLSAISHQAAVTMLHLHSRDRLLESEKLASFHKTASFVIHDLKNAISMLSLMVQNAPRKMSDPDFQRESIRTINHAVVRMQRIIEKLKTPPDKEQLQIAPINPIKSLYGAIEKSGVVNKNNVEVKILCDEVQPVNTDAGVLETVFINLLINAVEAMPTGGKIEIDQRIVNDRPQMTIRDEGIGMDQSFIDKKLFRPFETTKPKGLGVGLYQCREMLKEAGGEIKVESSTGKGTTFTLVFP